MNWNEQRISRQLKLRDLHVLMTVARSGSMGKAAHQLSVSQPAISKAIADMETALGVRLLDRNPRGVVPTIYARALLDRGLVAFDELKQGIEHLNFLANPTTGELRIGSTIAIATGFLPAVIDRLSRKYPRVVFHLSAGEAAMTYRSLEERSVDVVIAPMFASMAVEHLRTEILYDEPLVVVAGAQSAWARRRKIELAELAAAAWTLPPLESLYGSVVAEAFRAKGLDVPPATVFTSVTPARNALLATGRFVSIVQGSVMRFNLNNPAFKVLPIDLPTTRRPIGAITLKTRTLALSLDSLSTARMKSQKRLPSKINATAVFGCAFRAEKSRAEERIMTVLKVGFVGIRTDRLDETVALYRNVLGVPVTRQTDDLVGFKLADGTVLELYGPTNEFHSFFTTGPVVAFKVDNFDAARQAMLAAGVKFIGDVQHADGVSWQHFYGPDGTVLEIIGKGQGANPRVSG